MVVEYVAVQCYSCHTFQGMQRNKKGKFKCKICSEQQSFRKIYAVSYTAKPIREEVQKLNAERAHNEQRREERAIVELEEEYARAEAGDYEGDGGFNEASIDDGFQSASSAASAAAAVAAAPKWNEYITDDDVDDAGNYGNDGDDGDGMFVTSLPDRYGARGRRGGRGGPRGGGRSATTGGRGGGTRKGGRGRGSNIKLEDNDNDTDGHYDHDDDTSSTSATTTTTRRRGGGASSGRGRGGYATNASHIAIKQETTHDVDNNNDDDQNHPHRSRQYGHNRNAPTSRAAPPSIPTSFSSSFVKQAPITRVKQEPLHFTTTIKTETKQSSYGMASTAVSFRSSPPAAAPSSSSSSITSLPLFRTTHMPQTSISTPSNKRSSLVTPSPSSLNDTSNKRARLGGDSVGHDDIDSLLEAFPDDFASHHNTNTTLNSPISRTTTTVATPPPLKSVSLSTLSTTNQPIISSKSDLHAAAPSPQTFSHNMTTASKKPTNTTASTSVSFNTLRTQPPTSSTASRSALPTRPTISSNNNSSLPSYASSSSTTARIVPTFTVSSSMPPPLPQQPSSLARSQQITSTRNRAVDASSMLGRTQRTPTTNPWAAYITKDDDDNDNDDPSDNQNDDDGGIFIEM